MTEEFDDDFNLNELDDQELVTQMHDDLYDGLKDEIVEGTEILLDRGWGAEKVLNEALVGGMQIVGVDFRDGILFVPEVLLAANAMKGGMGVLKPLLAETGVKPIGKMVIGTVKGDIYPRSARQRGTFGLNGNGVPKPVQGYVRAGAGQGIRNRLPNAARRTGNHRVFTAHTKSPREVTSHLRDRPPIKPTQAY